MGKAVLQAALSHPHLWGFYSLGLSVNILKQIGCARFNLTRSNRLLVEKKRARGREMLLQMEQEEGCNSPWPLLLLAPLRISNLDNKVHFLAESKSVLESEGLGVI